jgi:DNA-binding NarL/FixJ family response regulator
MARSMANRATNTTRETAKVLIVDDHPAVREALSTQISRQLDLEVCGEAVDLADALQLFEIEKPDVAVIDISLKTGNGIDLIERIKSRNQNACMLVWSMYNDSLYAERALQAGAMGYINKAHATEKIVEAIRCVLNGKIYVSQQITEKLLSQVSGRTGDLERSAIESLSNRELQVFELIGNGLTTAEIAKKLHLGVKTIETHRQRIKTKLNLKTTAKLAREAAHWLLENG